MSTTASNTPLLYLSIRLPKLLRTEAWQAYLHVQKCKSSLCCTSGA